jgi:hypothetical protein
VTDSERYEVAERAAILEFDGRLSRIEAERQALLEWSQGLEK